MLVMVLNGPVGDQSTSQPFKYPYSVESQGPRLLARDLLRGDRAISLPLVRTRTHLSQPFTV